MNPKDWDKIKELLRTIIGDSADTGGDATAGTVMGKENAIISLLTSGEMKVVKSLQSVTYTVLANAGSTGEVAISTVIPKKCLVIFERIQDGTSSGAAYIDYTLGSDKLSFTHGSYSKTQIQARFWIVEFY